MAELSTSSGITLFNLDSVSLNPTTPRMKEPFVIRGKIKLFGLPFIGPVWVSASVTYPESFWEDLIPLWGSPVVTKSDIAIGGSFEVRFEDGFERQGEFKLKIHLYAGPTIQLQAFQKGLTLPPFPPADTIEDTFGVEGSVPDDEETFQFRQPVVTPPKPYTGDQVTFSVDVTSNSTKAESIVIKCDVATGSLLPSAGTTIKSYRSGIETIQPGETKTFTFTHTEIEPEGMRDLVITALAGTEIKGKHQFDDAYAVDHRVVDFVIMRAAATPNHVTPGQKVSISSQVTNKSTQAQDVTVKFNIYQGDVLPQAGPLLSAIPAPFYKMQPDETKTFSVEYTATQTSDARRDVGVEVWVGPKKIADTQDDDIFFVDVPNVDFVLMGPVATPKEAQPGQQVTISSDVTNNGNVAQDVMVKFNIYDEGTVFGLPIGSWAGKLIETLTAPSQRLEPSQTLPFSVKHTASQRSVANRDVGVEAWAGGKKVDDLQDDNIFSVRATPKLEFTHTKVVSNPVQARVNVGAEVPLSIDVTSKSNQSADIIVKFNIYEGQFWSDPKGLIETLTVPAYNIKPSETKTFTVYHTATSRPQTRRDVGIEIWTSGQKIVATSVPWDDVFFVSVPQGTAKLLVNSPIKQGASLSFSWSGFQAGQDVNIWVQGGGGTVYKSGANGSGSGAFAVGEPPGTYTLLAQDNYGHQATTTFVIQGTTAPSLRLSSTAIQSGGSLGFAWAGFQPNQDVNIWVQGGGGTAFRSDYTGAGSASFGSIGEPPGSYTLVAQDSYGHQATAAFTIQGAPATPTLKVTNSPIASGSTLNYEWSGFAPNQSVNIWVQGGGGVSHTSNYAGAGAGAFVLGESGGNYTLRAQDNQGHQASAPFVVTGGAITKYHVGDVLMIVGDNVDRFDVVSVGGGVYTLRQQGYGTTFTIAIQDVDTNPMWYKVS